MALAGDLDVPRYELDRSLTVKGGTDDGWAELDTLNKFTLLFGEEKTAELFKSYRDNYITEEDFKNVKALGFNCIRIPFWYRNFMSDENGTYITENDDENPGFVKLDFACEMAEKYNLYLILTCTAAPAVKTATIRRVRPGEIFCIVIRIIRS